MKRAVILGGSGFIGRWLARALTARGCQVVTIDRREPEAGHGGWIEADARDLETVGRAVRPGDLVVHLIHSSIPEESMADPAAEIRENVVPYEALLERLADLGAGLIVYSSTGGQVYGEALRTPLTEDSVQKPVSGYGASKLAMEQLTRLITRRRGLPHLILRISNPYGPFQELTNRHGIVPALFKSVIHGSVVTVYGGGETVRDYIYIEEAAEAAAGLLEAGVRDLTVNIGTGIGTSLSDLIQLVEEASGGEVKTEHAPIRKSDVKVNVLDISLLKELTGFTPKVGLEEGLKRTWEYMRANEKA